MLNIVINGGEQMPSKHAGGRPTIYRPQYGDKIAKAMAAGLSAEAAAAKAGISARCLYTWQHKHPEFEQAIQEGRHRALLWWEERALAMATGEAGSAQIVSLGLRNRSRAASGWEDRQGRELTGPAGGPVQIETTTIDAASLTPDQRDALRAALVGISMQG